MSKIMLVAGHGYNDPGAAANGYNERDFIRTHIVDRVAKYLRQAGHTVAVYGKSQDMYQDTAYGVRVGNKRDYGMYWVKSQGYEIVVEFHLDAAGAGASGGHVIYYSGYTPDSIDKGIRSAIEKFVGLRGNGFSARNNLLNCNVSADLGLNYRLVELGFITNKSDMQKIVKHVDAYCKAIAEGINGKPIVNPSAAKPKPKAKKTTKPAAVCTPTHKVKKGETLWSIARAYGLTVAALKSNNGLKGDTIRIGQSLNVKK